MENKLPIWQTAKDSFKFVYHHYMNWMRLASGPFVIMVLAGIFALVMGLSSNSFEVGDGSVNFHFEMQAEGGVQVLAFFAVALTSLLAFLMFSVNGYRYVMYNEGGDKWLEFRFDKNMWRVFLFSLLVGLIFALAFFVFSGGLLVVNMLEMPLLTLVFMFFGFVALAYLALRLMFVVPFAAIGMEKPIKDSLEVAKGRVMRLFLLVLLVMLLLILLLFAVMIVAGLVFGLFGMTGNLSMLGIGSGIMLVVQVLMNLFAQAVFFTAMIKAYKHIAGK